MGRCADCVDLAVQTSSLGSGLLLSFPASCEYLTLNVLLTIIRTQACPSSRSRFSSIVSGCEPPAYKSRLHFPTLRSALCSTSELASSTFTSDCARAQIATQCCSLNSLRAVFDRFQPFRQQPSTTPLSSSTRSCRLHELPCHGCHRSPSIWSPRHRHCQNRLSDERLGNPQQTRFPRMGCRHSGVQTNSYVVNADILPRGGTKMTT